MTSPGHALRVKDLYRRTALLKAELTVTERGRNARSTYAIQGLRRGTTLKAEGIKAAEDLVKEWEEV